jgi:type IV pilus assembly protein PilX
MLTARYYTHKARRIQQKGVTLVITLIVLVAMTLAVIAMVRSVDTSNLIAGNLAFQQSALHGADNGTEAAINVLLPAVINGNLQNCTINCPLGYLSWRQPLQEPPVTSWANFWQSVSGNAVQLPKDAVGNTVFYIVQALCDQNGQGGVCVSPPPSASISCVGSDLGTSTQKCDPPTQKYYRITTRVEGPRNSVGYTQTIIAM